MKWRIVEETQLRQNSLKSAALFIFWIDLFSKHNEMYTVAQSELSTGRMDPRVGSGRVGSGRVGSGYDFAGFWRFGSGRVNTSDFLVFYWLFLGT